MQLCEALYIAYNHLHNDEYLSKEQKEAERVIQNSVDENFAELVEQAVTILSSIPKEGTQELAITLTQILEGDINES